jgi:hypothetical protein
MKNLMIVVGLFGLGVTACSSSGASEGAAGSNRLLIETACTTDAECPPAFECESESEHGVKKSFCQSTDDIAADGTGAMCPAGYELELEHGSSFCKLHGGDDGGHEGGASSGHSGPDRGPGNDGGRDGADDHGRGGAGSDDGAEHEAGDDNGAGGDDNGEHGKNQEDGGASSRGRK